VVYIGSPDSNVYALDAKTGKQIWAVQMWYEGVIHSSPAIAGGVVYICSGKVHALSAATGDSIWVYQSQKEISSSPSVANGILYFGELNGGFYAIGDPNKTYPSPNIPTTNTESNTLVEGSLVIAIICILVALSVVIYRSRRNSKKKTH
jgi:outer membrane protein assembly factor BamB